VGEAGGVTETMVGVLLSKGVDRDQGASVPEGHANEALPNLEHQCGLGRVRVRRVDLLAPLDNGFRGWGGEEEDG